MALFLTLFFSFNANAYFFEKVKTYEIFQPKIFISHSNRGIASGKTCKNCKPVKFVVTPDTKAVNINGEDVALRDANKWTGKAVTYTYEIKTNKLLKITQEYGVYK